MDVGKRKFLLKVGIEMENFRGLWRGKRLDTSEHIGEWVEGFYFREIGDFIKEPPSSVSTKTYLVDPSTLGECTGLRDKNGVKIFEGDICTATNNFVDGEYGVVKYCEQEAIYTVNFTSARLDFSRQLQSETEIEVIGNIHDNPKLLNGTGEDVRNGGDTNEK